MKRISLFFLALLSCVFPLLHASADPITVTIGATLPLTGSLGYVGEDIRRGMQLALDKQNDAAIKIRVIFEDNQHQGKNAVTTAQKLLDIDHVDILVSLWDMADVVAPLTERKGIPHVSIRWNGQLAEKYKYTFTFESTYISYVKSQLELLKALGVHTVSLATEEAQGWILGANEFKAHAKEYGIEVLAEETYQPDTTDFRGIATKLLSRNPDMVVTYSFQPSLDLFLKRMREQRPAQRITGYFESVVPLSLVEGIPFTAQFDAASWFVKLFEDTYHESFRARAPHGYDLIAMIADTYRKAGKKLSSDEFIAQLARLKDFRGATGTLWCSPSKNIENTPVWKIAKNGHLELFTPEMVQSYRSSHKS